MRPAVRTGERGIDMILETSGERVKLLRAGFCGGEIETLFVVLNNFEIVTVNWRR